MIDKWWTWFRGSLVTCKKDGTIPLSSKCIMFNKDGLLEPPNPENARLIAAAPELLNTIEIIKCFCLTIEASHKDELFLRKLKEELSPIVAECEKALALLE